MRHLLLSKEKENSTNSNTIGCSAMGCRGRKGMYVCEYMIHGGRGMYVCDVCKWGYASEYMMCDVLHCAVSVFVYVWRVSCVCVCGI